MTNSLGDLLDRSKFAEPTEIKIIKTFVFEHFRTIPAITIQQSQIIIGVPNAALAGTLRVHLHELQELCQTKKRLVIRIG